MLSLGYESGIACVTIRGYKLNYFVYIRTSDATCHLVVYSYNIIRRYCIVETFPINCSAIYNGTVLIIRIQNCNVLKCSCPSLSLLTRCPVNKILVWAHACHLSWGFEWRELSNQTIRLHNDGAKKWRHNLIAFTCTIPLQSRFIVFTLQKTRNCQPEIMFSYQTLLI